MDGSIAGLAPLRSSGLWSGKQVTFIQGRAGEMRGGGGGGGGGGGRGLRWGGVLAAAGAGLGAGDEPRVPGSCRGHLHLESLLWMWGPAHLMILS